MRVKQWEDLIEGCGIPSLGTYTEKFQSDWWSRKKSLKKEKDRKNQFYTEKGLTKCYLKGQGQWN